MPLLNATLAKFESAAAPALYDYWKSKLDSLGGRLPGRRHIDPIELMERAPFLVPDLWLVDVLYPGPRFRLRLIGGSLVEAGVTVKVGMFIDENEKEYGNESLSGDLKASCIHKVPCYAAGEPLLSYSKFVPRLERLSVPLAEDGETVDMFISATHSNWIGSPRDSRTGPSA